MLEGQLLFHTICSAYQRTINDILGSGAAIFVHPTLDVIRKISERTGIELIRGETLDEAFENLLKILEESGYVEGARVEKLGPEKYKLYIQKCPFAKVAHSTLNIRGCICLYPLLALAIYEEYTGKRVKLNPSEFTEEGTITIIEGAES